MKLPTSGVLATAIVALGALCASSATATTATPKPGFLPGTWIGKGTIGGTAVDGPMTTRFSGKIRFKLQVSTKLRVSGTGTWAVDMQGTEDAGANSVNSTLKGSAAVSFSGAATSPTFSGTNHVTGSISAYGVTRPLRFDQKLGGRLAITRAGTCRVSGGSQIQAGVKLEWSALLQGSGVCRA